MTSPRPTREKVKSARGVGSARAVDKKYRKLFGLDSDEHHVGVWVFPLFARRPVLHLAAPVLGLKRRRDT
jgi:hypothetical protein